MKKVLKVLSAAFLAAVVAASAATVAFAAEENKINDAEQKVLTRLKTETVNMAGTQKPLKAQWINQAEDCFTKVDMTDAQAETAIKKIEELKAYLESLNKASIADMTDEEIAKAESIANEAAGVVGAKLSFAKGPNTVSYTLQGSDKKDESSKAAPAGDNPIKTTGLDVPGVAAVAGVAVLAVSAAGIYVISTSKKKETVGA